MLWWHNCVTNWLKVHSNKLSKWTETATRFQCDMHFHPADSWQSQKLDTGLHFWHCVNVTSQVLWLIRENDFYFSLLLHEDRLLWNSRVKMFKNEVFNEKWTNLYPMQQSYPRTTVSIMGAECAETVEKKLAQRSNLKTVYEESVCTEEEMETWCDGEKQTQRQRQRDRISLI